MHNYERPITLSVAGYDPTGGAGTLADCKTMEQLGCLGMGVITAVTGQTEEEFYRCVWQDLKVIRADIRMLMNTYKVRAVKVGLVQDMEMLGAILETVRACDAGIPIVLDPVLKSSSGYVVQEQPRGAGLERNLSRVTLITPNLQEALALAGGEDAMAAAEALSAMCAVLLKGGHNEAEPGVDYLYEKGKAIKLEPKVGRISAKHGSGCILSAAICAELAKGQTLLQACEQGKIYITDRLASNEGLLAYHSMMTEDVQ